MKTLIIAALVALTPAIGFAMGCSSDHERTTAASCPTGQTWDAQTSSCTDTESS